MSNKLPVTVTIITRNESSRIQGAIESVRDFCSEVIVVDSESTDATVSIAERLGAKVHVKPFGGFGQQKNSAHSLAPHEWVLNLDADERVSPDLRHELEGFFASQDPKTVFGAFLPRKTWYLNRWVMHGGWYPNYLLRLSRKEGSRWTEPTIHEELRVEGRAIEFQHPLEHYSFPNQRSHILKNVEYAAHASRGLAERGKHASGFDLVAKPIWKFLDGYFLRAGFLDGRAGLFIAIHSAYAMFLRYAYLYEQTAQHPDSRQ